MAILENRVKKYNNRSKKLNRSVSLTSSITLNLLSLLTILLLLANINTDKFKSATIDFKGYVTHNYISPAKNMIIVSLNTASSFFNITKLSNENLKLKFEIEKLRAQKNNLVTIQKENNKIKSKYRFIKKSDNIIARSEIIIRSSDANGENAIIHGGSRDNLKIGNIILSSGNLVGRIVNLGENYSKTLLVNSYKSRIPVKTQESGLLSILVGDGSNKGHLIHTNERQKPEEGEIIVTSGHGSIYPKDLPVAVVTKVSEDTVEVTFLENPSSIEFVDIVDTANLFM